MVTEYNQSGYYVAGDTIEGFQYELSQAISALSGLEVQTQLEMSLAESFKQLSDNQCDVIARNIPITSDIKEDYLFTVIIDAERGHQLLPVCVHGEEHILVVAVVQKHRSLHRLRKPAMQRAHIVS